MTTPSPDEIDRLFATIPPVPADAVEAGPMHQIVCADCWADWLVNDPQWRCRPVRLVTILHGRALCQEHFRAAAGLPKATDG